MADPSMEPTIHCASPVDGCTADEADQLRATKDGSLERGDIIAFRIPRGAMACAADSDAVFIKRIVALPGEEWAERNGYIYIHGRRLHEPYVENERRSSETLPAKKVPPRTYVVLGDNRSLSCDSRLWGALPQRNVIGRIFAVVRGDDTITID